VLYVLFGIALCFEPLMGAIFFVVFAGFMMIFFAAGLFALGNAAFAGTVVVASIVTRTYRQTATPTELLPRVVATVRVVSWGVIPVGALAAGTVATWYGPRAALWWAAAATLVVPVVVLTSPIRTRRDIAEG